MYISVLIQCTLLILWIKINVLSEKELFSSLCFISFCLVEKLLIIYFFSKHSDTLLNQLSPLNQPWQTASLCLSRQQGLLRRVSWGRKKLYAKKKKGKKVSVKSWNSGYQEKLKDITVIPSRKVFREEINIFWSALLKVQYKFKEQKFFQLLKTMKYRKEGKSIQHSQQTSSHLFTSQTWANHPFQIWNIWSNIDILISFLFPSDLHCKYVP